jgi:hypothetical protein
MGHMDWGDRHRFPRDVFFRIHDLPNHLGESDPNNWLTKLTKTHYAALVGTPMSAVTAFCIVSLLKVTSGPIEFEALGFKFRGASGPIILWVLCFLAVAAAFHLLWPNVG